jgi:hypothetical protein
MSFCVVWKATDEKKHFRFDGYRAIAQAEAEVGVPSLNFSWKSDPTETSRSGFAIIGNEVNGKYYDMRTSALSQIL